MKDDLIIAVSVLCALVGALFCLLFLTVGLGVSALISVPMGLLCGAVAPFIGE